MSFKILKKDLLKKKSMNIILTLFVLIFAAAMVGIAQIGFVLPLFFKCLPALVLVSSLQFFAFTLSDNTVSSVLIQFFGAISLSYLCGCIYPISFFPNFLETVGNAFPLGVARSFLITALISDIDFLCIFVPGHNAPPKLLSYYVNTLFWIYDSNQKDPDTVIMSHIGIFISFETCF
jgi:hypothetical protein